MLFDLKFGIHFRKFKANFPVRTVLHSAFQPIHFHSMRDIKVPRTLDTDEESPNYQPDSLTTPEIEKTYVHRVYDAIAPHFSSTRFAKWPKVSAFLSSLPKGSLVLDVGCGNGKYLGLNTDCFFIGCDISQPLVNICTERGHEALVADAVNIAYRDNFADSAISIAVLHHLSTETRRKKAIEELVRVVRKGGLVLITVWAAEQEDKGLLTKWTPLNQKYLDEWIGPGSPRVRSPRMNNLESIPESEEGKNDQQEYFVPWHLPYHRAEVSGASVTEIASGFAKKDDKKGAVVYNRYYHVFSQGELERLVSGMSNTVIVDRFFDKSNWCIVLEKTQ
ncbi:hypothetical protein V2J09_017363 [Rumex salicifolius]